MSEIEKRAQPVLTKMILGERAELDSDSQVAVATWASLKTVVGQAMNSQRVLAPKDIRDYLFKTRRPPEDWRVGITSYQGEHHAFYEGFVHDFLIEDHKGGSRKLPGKRVHASFVIRNLAIKVLGLRGEGIRYPGSDALLFVWPVSPLILLWPPPLGVDDALFDQFLKFQIR